MITVVAALLVAGSGPAAMATPVMAFQAEKAGLTAKFNRSLAELEQTVAKAKVTLANSRKLMARSEALRKLIEADKKAEAEKRRIDD